MTYELPFGKGKKWMNHSRMLDTVFGGYSFSWNFSVWAPTPTGIGYSGGTYINPVTGAIGARQDYPNYEATLAAHLYLVQVPQIRDGVAGHRNQPLRRKTRRTRWSPTAAPLRSCSRTERPGATSAK